MKYPEHTIGVEYLTESTFHWKNEHTEDTEHIYYKEIAVLQMRKIELTK